MSQPPTGVCARYIYGEKNDEIIAGLGVVMMIAYWSWSAGTLMSGAE